MENEIDYSVRDLYVVTVIYEAYVYADSYEDAKSFAEEIVDTEVPSDIAIERTETNILNWAGHELVYQDESAPEMTLNEVLEEINNKK